MNQVDNGNQWLMVTKTKREVNRNHGAPEHGQRPLSPAEHVGEFPASLLLVLECHCQLSVCQLSACQLSACQLSTVSLSSDFGLVAGSSWQQPPLLSACHRARHLPQGAPRTSNDVQGGEGDQEDKPGGPALPFPLIKTLFAHNCFGIN